MRGIVLQVRPETEKWGWIKLILLLKTSTSVYGEVGHSRIKYFPEKKIGSLIKGIWPWYPFCHSMKLPIFINTIFFSLKHE
jgi:hypothetical protein